MASSEESTIAANRNASRSSARWREMSRAIFDVPMIVPAAVLIGETDNESSMVVPSFR